MSKVDLHTKIDFSVKKELKKTAFELNSNISKVVEASIRMGLDYAKKNMNISNGKTKPQDETQDLQIENNGAVDDGTVCANPLDTMMNIAEKEKQQSDFSKIMKKHKEDELELEKRALKKTWPKLSDSQKTTYIECKRKKMDETEVREFFKEVGILEKEFEALKNKTYTS